MKHGLPFSITTLFVLSCALAVLICTTEAAIELPSNETIPAVIMFGDSIADTGNNNDLMSLTKCNFPPYGREFKGGIPTGRFSNGKVPSDFLGSTLSLSLSFAFLVLTGYFCVFSGRGQLLFCFVEHWKRRPLRSLTPNLVLIRYVMQINLCFLGREM